MVDYFSSLELRMLVCFVSVLARSPHITRDTNATQANFSKKEFYRFTQLKNPGSYISVALQPLTTPTEVSEGLFVPVSEPATA